MRAPALGLALISALGVCDRERQDRPGETSVTSSTLELVPNRMALDRVIAAQCMREQLCVEVGLAREDASSCADRARTATCTTSIESRRLEECLQAIYTSSCSTEFEARGALDPCRAHALCPER
jgi:hypothetical protein